MDTKPHGFLNSIKGDLNHHPQLSGITLTPLISVLELELELELEIFYL